MRVWRRSGLAVQITGCHVLHFSADTAVVAVGVAAGKGCHMGRIGKAGRWGVLEMVACAVKRILLDSLANFC